ncbi:putative reverse transcriptase domain-containing protein [Tanacetum coccineum]
MEDTLSKFKSESAKRHEENSNLIKEIQASTDAAIRNQGASIKTLEIQIGQMSKSISTTIEIDSCPIRRIGTSQYAVSTGQNRTLIKEKDPRSFTLPCFINNVCFDNALVDLGASVSVMPLSTYLNLGLGELAHIKLIVELADRTVKYPKGIAKNVLVGIGKFVFLVDFIILDMPEDIKVPLILRRPFLSTARVKIDVYKRKITLRVGEERIVFTSVKPASSLIKRVYMLSLRERMELDLEARLMGETLVINQGDDLMTTIEEGEVIEEFRTRDDELDAGIDDYPSYCDYDKKIHIDCSHNLKFSCMIGFEFTHANFFTLLYVNVMSKKFHNSIMKEKMVYKGNNVIGALINVPIFVGTFSVMTDFAVLENMDDYRDEGMGDVIFGEPFLREVGIKTRRFEGMITIYNGDNKVTYQMVRSHPRFKHHTNEQCNKIPSLMKVSEEDKMNGISHPYQKLKGFYKGVLNLGPDYIRDAKTEEWLTRGHISVHEMEWIQMCADAERKEIGAYASRQLKIHEKNYATQYLELGVVVFALKTWRHYLYWMKSVIYTDHKSLQHIFDQIGVKYASESGVKDKILTVQSEASKVENAPAEILHGLDQQIKKNKGAKMVVCLDEIECGSLVGSVKRHKYERGSCIEVLGTSGSGYDNIK